MYSTPSGGGGPTTRKTLAGMAITNSIGNNVRGNYIGSDGLSAANEVQAQVRAIEALRFSMMGGRVLSGASVSSGLRFRNASNDGNQTCSRTGAGDNEDAVNVDDVAADALFNFNHTTGGGTAAVYAFIKGNMAPTTAGTYMVGMLGAGNMSGTVYDLDSSTTYIVPVGATTNDGVAVEARTQLPIYGYSSIEAIDIYVMGNARLTDTVIRTRVDTGSGPANGGLSITIAGGDTTVGRRTSTGTPDALNPGDKISISITTGDAGGGAAGADLQIAYVVLWMKSTTGKSDFGCSVLASGRAASATEHFITPLGRQTTYVSSPMTRAQARVKVGYPARLSKPRAYVDSYTYASSVPMVLYVNDTATDLVVTIDGTGWKEDSTHTVDIDADDEICWGIVGGTSGSMALINCAITAQNL